MKTNISCRSKNLCGS